MVYSNASLARMSDNKVSDLVATIATHMQEVARAFNLGAGGTKGPGLIPHDPAPPPDIAAPTPHEEWNDGKYSGATFIGAHAGRVGGPIVPIAIGVHTTDMLPKEFPALKLAWTTKPADGACAHFGIDRDGSIWQFVQITRNGNHLGGPGHGVFVDPDGKQVHPNLIAIGIEVHCAGGVRLVSGEWRLVENGVAHGEVLPASDVTPDPQRPGRGWHHITDAQQAALRSLVASLRAHIAPMPAGWTTRSLGEAVPAWAHHSGSPVVVGHVELDPTHRSDPWPEAYASGLMAELNA